MRKIRLLYIIDHLFDELYKKALFISNVSRAKHTELLKDAMAANNGLLQTILVKMTHHLQPLKVFINGLALTFMRSKNEEWDVKEMRVSVGRQEHFLATKQTQKIIDTRLTMIP